jgi:sugar (pentulose or hexulose) kinase
MIINKIIKINKGELEMSNNFDQNKKDILEGKTAIGIELGSTRIKAVMIGSDNFPIASGSYDWENSLVNNIWTYSLDEVWKGVQGSYKSLVDEVKKEYDVDVKTTGAIGISAMMHGYMVFDKDDNQLTPFRTWRNNITGQASKELTELFDYPIPERWSIAHLYQAILNKEEHVDKISHMTTLAGYVHWKLTGEKILGVGEASGVFPIDLKTKDYSVSKLGKFDKYIEKYDFSWKLEDLMPKTLKAGESAGKLTKEGAKLLDVTGNLEEGVTFCPPEGDAGTGMVATNSVKVRTGNVSAGTSVFAMIVLEKELSKAHSEIDLVTTPDGNLVAMVHSNNCTSNYDSWISIFGEVVKALGFDVSKPKLYDVLLEEALKGDPDCGGLLSYGYVSGEHITHFEAGRPLFVRSSDNNFNLANFMRVNLFTSLGALRTGLKILFEEENVKVDEIKGHGGFFKTKEVGQKIMAAATTTPISIMETAGEGGAWGIALLATYVNNNDGLSLDEFLAEKIFAGKEVETVNPSKTDIEGFDKFFLRYTKGLKIERAAVDNF